MESTSTVATQNDSLRASIVSLASLEAQYPSWSLRPRNIVVFSGGSAANNLVDLFKKITEDKKCQLSYVIPISDNGGSSSELIRVFGGPGMSEVIE
jgi:2-phospho-L-lactate transferase CofD